MHAARNLFVGVARGEERGVGIFRGVRGRGLAWWLQVSAGMSPQSLVMVSVIVPESMEDPIAAEMMAQGAHGYTAWTVRGRGTHGARPSSWNGSNVRVETAVSEEVAAKIVARMLEKNSAAVPLMVMTSPVTIYPR